MRIDRALAEKYGSRTKAARAAENGEVLVNGKPVSPSYDLKDSDDVTFFEPEKKFVSVGGFKLEKALSDFCLDVSGGTFADIGASTGGFTDCLFQRGAAKVYCVDVGEGQLDKSLLGEKTVVIDGFNARNLSPSLFDEPLDGAVADVSFISLTCIMDAVAAILSDDRFFLGLVKPQFELDKKSVGKNGIVKDPALRRAAVSKVYKKACDAGLSPVSLTEAPRVAGKNREYPMLFVKGATPAPLSTLLRDAGL
ncbi:MAG: TlyA family RNA methyltransferase [Clostridia bacterium]|nr:TlyA family RNA methyltransferase [Clostridia bacterium]